MRPKKVGEKVEGVSGIALGDCGCPLDKHSELGSEECSESGFSIHKLNFNEVFNEKFFMNEMGKSLH